MIYINSKKFITKSKSIMAFGLIALLTGCGGGSSNSSNNQTYSIGGSLTGLISGQAVMLKNNTSGVIILRNDGAFTFSTQVPFDGSYNVTVATQPNNEICTVTNGSGAGVTADINNIVVKCSEDSYTIGGTVSGLTSGQQVTLVNNGDITDSVTQKANGSFIFKTPVAFDSSYNVTVATQPNNEICTVTNGSGAGVTADINNIVVKCSEDSYTIGGTVSGLTSGQQVTLINNGDIKDPVIQKADGSFTFTTPVAFDSSYNVTISTQPTNEVCTVTNGFGINVTTNISNVTVTCYSYNLLYSFAGDDGANPYASLIQGSDGNFYGTTVNGGANVSGTAFYITPTGTEKIFYSFGDSADDGANPKAGLIQGSDGNFYGTTVNGGENSRGTVFKITPTSTETVLHSFAGADDDGANPQAGLIQGHDGNFYGTTEIGGVNTNNGTVFKTTESEIETTVLYSFAGADDDGAYPYVSLIQGHDGNFYGTTANGGANNKGTVFKITESGIETVLHSFAGAYDDGANPQGALIQDSNGGFFYGTTAGGGAYNKGTVFKIMVSDASITEIILYSFGRSGDGAYPHAGLIQASDGNFYGTTENGGAYNKGTVFKITESDASITEIILYSFGRSGDGAYPHAGLIQESSGTFYGTTVNGGTHNNGTVFKITQ